MARVPEVSSNTINSVRARLLPEREDELQEAIDLGYQLGRDWAIGDASLRDLRSVASVQVTDTVSTHDWWHSVTRHDSLAESDVVHHEGVRDAVRHYNTQFTRAFVQGATCWRPPSYVAGAGIARRVSRGDLAA
ncbi:MAG: hypothetical protein JW940_30525 [Polyangiaceae bacterium]|nr:hypothetical protein [Polyangiaceae bacterium]